MQQDDPRVWHVLVERGRGLGQFDRLSLLQGTGGQLGALFCR